MRKSVLLLIVVAMLAACGLKGPLYVPEQKPAAAPSVVTPGLEAPADTKKIPEAK